MAHYTRITVRFGDCDPAGLVYYPTILHYLHIAMEEFFRECCGIEYHRLMAEERIGFPTVNTQTEFFVPLVYGDETEIEVRVLKVGNSSLTLGYTVRRISDSTVCASTRNVHVAMNLDTRRPEPIPSKFRSQLEAELTPSYQQTQQI
jgi:YbgC/YbaW family acyl-CoA thioester hydrolase